MLRLGFVIAACLAGCAPRGELTGTWVGGFTLDSEVTPLVWLAFDEARGRADATWSPILHREKREHFEIALDGVVHVFDVQTMSDAVLEGTVVRGASRGTFHFDRLGPAQDIRGDYGAYFLSGEPRLLDVESGATHALFPRVDGTFLVGPGRDTAYPSVGELLVVRDGGRIVGVEFSGHHDRREIRKRDVTFVSNGATLAGTVYRAAGDGPHPGVVFVHGSGRSTRDEWWQQAFARVFLREGFDVLLYDKRGAGASGGQYVGRGAADENNVSRANLEQLAHDARAAHATLSSLEGVDPKRVGFFGLSQAGWVIPLAADNAAFVVELAGPAVSTFLEDVYSKLVAGSLSLDDADTVLKWAPHGEGFDPAPALSRLKMPALFLYGDRDSSIPFRASVRALATLSSSFEVVVLPGAGHEMFEVERDTDAANSRAPGLSREGLEALRAWLKRLAP